MPPSSPQLPPANPAGNALVKTVDSWFLYPIRVHPHHSDYAGVVWHGSYIAWMEEARVECLRSMGVDFAELVAMGCDLPVVELAMRYHQPIRLGMDAVVKSRMADMTGVRMKWEQQFQSIGGEVLFVTAHVTLVAVDREKGKIMRRLPPQMKDALVKWSAQ